MAKKVTLKIDGKEVTVSEGTLVVDAAKQIGIDIPVFCYHPKMEPVGMCRMCLVEVGRPVIDRASGQPVLEADGSPKIQFAPKLDTACTTPVSPGMVVVTANEKVKAARKDILEFILTSHPLDCPICDKGGECPLQNLTMGFGPGQSRFLFDEKMRFEKHTPLGELIWLDRERCIQCGRCVRFQHELVDDPVINFYQRGRALEIITCSEPGFDSIWSGNTSDICPVGALTTADFRFGARPWEMKATAGICNHCPVGCNLTYNIRREAKAEGGVVIKRVMPRQNEQVNEIWICDKGRFAYHYAESKERLTTPLVRRDGELQPATWEEALDLAAAKFREAGAGLVTLAGGRLANEDLFNLAQLTQAQGGETILYQSAGGGDLVSQFGLAPGSNLGDLGKGDVILVAAADLHQEAPLWWLRVRLAARRGARLVVVHPRLTRLEKYAAHTVRHAYGEAVTALRSLLPGGNHPAAQELAQAEHLVVFLGSEGMDLAESDMAARLCAELLAATGHAGRVNNGLVGVWQNGNTQGAWELGFRPVDDLGMRLEQAQALYLAAADPAGDHPGVGTALERAGFVVAQELFLTATARLADVVLPALPPTEREGSYTSGERRVQRFYPAVPPRGGARADFAITAQIAERMGVALEGRGVALVMMRIAETIPAYAGITYQKLAETTTQYPLVGRHDLYYGGTTYENSQGLGVHLALAEKANLPPLPDAQAKPLPENGVRVRWLSALYDRGTTITPSTLLAKRLAQAQIRVAPALAQVRGWQAGAQVELTINGSKVQAEIQVDDTLTSDTVLAVRSVGLPEEDVWILD